MGVNLTQRQLFVVQEAKELEKWVERISAHTVVGVDTESNSLYVYQERVCLIQFSTPEEDVIVDPLAIQDISSLGEIFRNPRILKIFHAAEYDLLGLGRDFGFKCHSLFDTMIAARVLGRPQVGLGALLEAEFGVRLDKRFQRANWGKRPLSPALLLYAQEDTRYLIPLYQRLEQGLKDKGLEPLAQEDFRRLGTNSRKFEGPKGDDRWWGVHSACDLAPEKLPVLRELYQAREEIARRLDRPRFKVLPDRKLIEIARECPTRLYQLEQLGILSPGELSRYGTAILAAVHRGLQSPPLYSPPSSRPSEEYLARLEALRQWRKSVAQQMGVPSDVVLPREVMLRIVDAAPKTKAELRQTMWDVPYRLERFGEQILRLLQS